jgi:type I restriction enzyme S subunit
VELTQHTLGHRGESEDDFSIWKINQGHIASIRIPIPPLKDQRLIMAELDALRAEVDRLKLLQSDTTTEIDALLPTILDRAFKGEL